MAHQMITRKRFLIFMVVLFIFFSIVLRTTVQIDHVNDTLRKYSLKQNENGIKVMVVIGTRPEAIKMAPVIRELRLQSDRFQCILVSTGQHKEMLAQVLEIFNLQSSVDIDLNVMRTDQTLSGLTSLVMTEMSKVLEVVKPDILLVQGDTTTAFIAALAAFYKQIPVGHVEAGLRTRELYSPFPEEINRQSIGNLASIHFAATTLAAQNLFEEKKTLMNIFVTGNPVVDALYEVSSLPESSIITSIRQKIANVMQNSKYRLVLLTAHRRENHGEPLKNIIKAVAQLLIKFPDVVVVYPVHLNPRVRQSIRDVAPDLSFTSLSDAAVVKDPNSSHYNRLLLIDPLSYQDLVKLMSLSEFILTDSGGIQEEGISMGKPIFVLRTSTERQEGVNSGAAVLIGTETEVIFTTVSKILVNPEIGKTMTASKNLYGDGKAAKRIIALIRWFFESKEASHHNPPFKHYIPSSPDPSAVTSAPRASSQTFPEKPYDLVVVFTVWKRATLDEYFQMAMDQTILKTGIRTNIVVFQNNNYLDVSEIVKKWSDPKLWLPNDVTVTYIYSPIPTGYYGRFLTPLLFNVDNENGKFILCDDDLIFGKRYWENLLRVVDQGFLATRNGRFIPQDPGASGKSWDNNVQVTFEEDVLYDFGGQMWAGKFDWLQKVWQHPPATLMTAEDLWISAALKTHYGILTKRPRCPKLDMEQCSCSMKIAVDHQPGEVVGTKVNDATDRRPAEELILKHTRFVPNGADVKAIEANAYTFHRRENGWPFSLEGTRFQNCLWWS